VEFVDKPELIKVAQRVREDLLIKNWYHDINTCSMTGLHIKNK
jgi:hypothetical protein